MQAKAKKPSAAKSAHGGASPYWSRNAIVTLTALTGINLFNYMDRFVMSALLPQIEKAPELGGLGLNKQQLGTLYSAFIIVYAATSPVFGVLGDRMKRMWIIAAAVALWSAATGASGFAYSMAALMIARACTGIGEAAYASITPSVISDVVPRSSRGRALSIFNAAIPIGSALGFMVGGWVAERYGWRHAFVVAGVPGLLLAVWCFFLKEPKRGGMDPGHKEKPAEFLEALRKMCRRDYVLPVAGYVLQTAGFGALAIWAPSYLQQARGMNMEAATFNFGLVVVVTGFLGTMFGGWLGDKWLRKNRSGLMWVCTLSSLVAVPFIVIMLMTKSDMWLWISISVGCFFLVMSVGPVNAQIVNALSPTERATGVAVCTTLIHLLGDVPSVPLIGQLVDSMTGGAGQVSEGFSLPFVQGWLEALPHNLSIQDAWSRALAVVPICIFAGSVVWLVGALWPTREADRA